MIEMKPEVFTRNYTWLTNQIYKLLPMFENKEAWPEQLKNVQAALIGFNALFPDQLHYLHLLGKLAALPEYADDYKFYKKLIFECLTELTLLKEGL